MNNQKRKPYKHQKINKESVEYLMNAFGIIELTADLKRMIEQIKPFIDYFGNNSNKLPNFYQLLHDCKFKNEDVKILIEEFIKHMNETYNIIIILLKPREMNKANSDVLNILINYIAHKYQDKLMSFLKNNLEDIIPEKNKKDELIENFQKNINILCSIDGTTIVDGLFDTLFQQPEENDTLGLFDQEYDETFFTYSI